MLFLGCKKRTSGWILIFLVVGYVIPEVPAPTTFGFTDQVIDSTSTNAVDPNITFDSGAEIDDNSNGAQGSGPNVGAVIGGVLGGLAGLTAARLVVVKALHSYKKRQDAKQVLNSQASQAKKETKATTSSVAKSQADTNYTATVSLERKKDGLPAKNLGGAAAAVAAKAGISKSPEKLPTPEKVEPASKNNVSKSELPAFDPKLDDKGKALVVDTLGLAGYPKSEIEKRYPGYLDAHAKIQGQLKPQPTSLAKPQGNAPAQESLSKSVYAPKLLPASDSSSSQTVIDTLRAAGFSNDRIEFEDPGLLEKAKKENAKKENAEKENAEKAKALMDKKTSFVAASTSVGESSGVANTSVLVSVEAGGAKQANEPAQKAARQPSKRANPASELEETEAPRLTSKPAKPATELEETESKPAKPATELEETESKPSKAAAELLDEEIAPVAKLTATGKEAKPLAIMSPDVSVRRSIDRTDQETVSLALRDSSKPQVTNEQARANAATKIQAAFKGFLGRKRLKELNEARQEKFKQAEQQEQANIAATAVQRVWRGYFARKQLKEAASQAEKGKNAAAEGKPKLSSLRDRAGRVVMAGRLNSARQDGIKLSDPSRKPLDLKPFYKEQNNFINGKLQILGVEVLSTKGRGVTQAALGQPLSDTNMDDLAKTKFIQEVMANPEVKAKEYYDKIQTSLKNGTQDVEATKNLRDVLFIASLHGTESISLGGESVGLRGTGSASIPTVLKRLVSFDTSENIEANVRADHILSFIEGASERDLKKLKALQLKLEVKPTQSSVEKKVEAPNDPAVKGKPPVTGNSTGVPSDMSDPTRIKTPRGNFAPNTLKTKPTSPHNVDELPPVRPPAGHDPYADKRAGILKRPVHGESKRYVVVP